MATDRCWCQHRLPKLEVTGDRVSLDIKAEISSVMETNKGDGPPPSLPIIRNNQWESTVILPLKQPSVLFSSDIPLEANNASTN